MGLPVQPIATWQEECVGTKVCIHCGHEDTYITTYFTHDIQCVECDKEINGEDELCLP